MKTWLAAVLCLLAASQASARTLAIIGDSIAQATHTRDDCGELDLVRCLRDRLLAKDTEFSFVAGSAPWALRNALGFAAVVDRSRDGARWDDALVQARQATAAGAVDGALILLGGNDVCRSAGESPPPLADVEAHVHATLTHLTDALAPRATVYIADVPDVVQLYELMRERDHNLVFENCQATWDLDYARIKDSAVVDACEAFFGNVCEGSLSGRLLDETGDTLTSVLQETLGEDITRLEGSCGNVLGTDGSAASRAEARTFNIALNAMLARKSAEFDRRGGVRVLYAEALFEEALQPADISRIDCFHPSRAGQQRIALALAGAIQTAVQRDAARTIVPLLLELLRDEDAPDAAH